MAVNKVEICGLDTSKLPMMTYERSTELLKKISEGDEEARDIFIKENLRLVLSVIQRFSGRGEQMDDLFQVGCIGLIKAINNFDLSLGDISVQLILEKLGGGGHQSIAGAQLKDVTMDEAISRLTESINSYLKEAHEQ